MGTPTNFQTVESFLNSEGAFDDDAANSTPAAKSFRSVGSEWFRQGEASPKNHGDDPVWEPSSDDLEPPYKMWFGFLDECYADPINPISEQLLDELRNAVESLSRNEGEPVRLADVVGKTSSNSGRSSQNAAEDFLRGNLGIKVTRTKSMNDKKTDKEEQEIRRDDSKWRNSSPQPLASVDAARCAQMLLTHTFNPMEFLSTCRKEHDKLEFQFLTHMFSSPYDLMGRYSIQMKDLVHWMEEIQEKYEDSNPYHNWGHAIGVAHFCYYSTVSEGGEFLNFQDVLAVFVAALAHDVGHPGLSENFLINSRHELAIRYNDRSVLESMHAHVAWQALRKYNFMSEADTKMDTFRQKVICAILATDMKDHSWFAERFKTRVDQLAGDAAASRAGQQGYNPLMTDTKDKKERQEASKSDRRMLLEAFLKVGDLSGNAQPFKIQLLLVKSLEEENFLQGDRERDLQMPVTRMFDRKKDSLGSAQRFFLGQIVRGVMLPFRAIVSKQLGADFLGNLDANRDRWEEIMAREQKVVGEHVAPRSVQDLYAAILMEEADRTDEREEEKRESATT